MATLKITCVALLMLMVLASCTYMRSFETDRPEISRHFLHVHRTLHDALRSVGRSVDSWQARNPSLRKPRTPPPLTPTTPPRTSHDDPGQSTSGHNRPRRRKPARCQCCGSIFDDPKDLKAHLISAHYVDPIDLYRGEPKPWRCMACNARCRSLPGYAAHLAWPYHKERRKDICWHCHTLQCKSLSFSLNNLQYPPAIDTHEAHPSRWMPYLPVINSNRLTAALARHHLAVALAAQSGQSTRSRGRIEPCPPGESLSVGTWPSTHPSRSQLLASCLPRSKKNDRQSFPPPGHYFYPPENELRLITTTTLQPTTIQHLDNPTTRQPPPEDTPPRSKGQSRPNPRKGKRPMPSSPQNQQSRSRQDQVRERQCLLQGARVGLDLEGTMDPEVCFVENNPSSQDFGYVICLDTGGTTTTSTPGGDHERGTVAPRPSTTPRTTNRVIQAPTTLRPSTTPSSQQGLGRPGFPWQNRLSNAAGGIVCLLALKSARSGSPTRHRHQASQIKPTPPQWSPPMAWNTAIQMSWEPFVKTVNAALRSAKMFEQESGYEWSCVTTTQEALLPRWVD